MLLDHLCRLVHSRCVPINGGYSRLCGMWLGCAASLTLRCSVSCLILDAATTSLNALAAPVRYPSRHKKGAYMPNWLHPCIRLLRPAVALCSTAQLRVAAITLYSHAARLVPYVVSCNIDDASVSVRQHQAALLAPQENGSGSPSAKVLAEFSLCLVCRPQYRSPQERRRVAINRPTSPCRSTPTATSHYKHSRPQYSHRKFTYVPFGAARQAQTTWGSLCMRPLLAA